MKRNDPLISYLEKRFSEKHIYNHEIAVRKVELSIREHDENIGGGRSNTVSKPVEEKIIKELSDPYIAKRELWKKAIEETLNEQSDHVRYLIELKYWGKEKYLDWTTFGSAHGYSKSTIYRIRQQVLMSFGRKIGEIN